MTYLLMILLAALLYGLARVVVNDIKDHITKEIDQVIISLKTGNYVGMTYDNGIQASINY